MHVLQRTRHLRHPLTHLARAKAWRDLNTTAVAAAAAAAAAATTAAAAASSASSSAAAAVSAASRRVWGPTSTDA